MIDNEYTLKTILGRGTSSKVFLANNSEGHQCAIKVLEKKWSKRMTEREHSTLVKLEKHPNIINALAYNTEGVIKIRDNTELVRYSVLEYAQNGCLSDYIRHCGPIEEEVTRFFSVQLLSAMEFIHSQNFAHLDLKLENILLDEFFNLKVADLGSSMHMESTNGLVHKKKGTYAYMAPEVYTYQKDESYNAFSADVYSLGVFIFVMLVGEFPTFIQKDDGRFDTNDTDEEDFCVHAPLEEMSIARWDSLSDQAKHLIKGMLHSDPSKRFTLSQVRNSEWIRTQFASEVWEASYNEMKSRKAFMTLN